MRLAVPVKMLSQRFALPVLVFASVVMVVLGKSDTLLFERVRVVFAALVSPVLGIVSQPVAAVHQLLDLAPDPSVCFVSARVIANSGGSFVRSGLIDGGSREGIARGKAAMT